MQRTLAGAHLAACALTLLAAVAEGRPSRWHADADPIADHVTRLARPLVEGELVHGLVVGWIRDGERRVVGMGRTSRDDARVPDGDSVFEIGSVTKVLTGLLLARASVRGDVALEDHLNTLLPPDFKLPPTEPPVRLVDLATHTAGMPDLPDSLARDPTQFLVDYSSFDDAALAELTRHFAPAPAARGTYLYSNAGYGLLGWALARRAGLELGELLERDLTRPLGLGDTSMVLSDDQRERLVQGHDPNGDPVGRTNFASLAACGGALSSANDLLALLAAFIEADASAQTPLSAAMRLATAPRATAPNGVGVGLAWHIALDGTTHYHDGQTGGFTSFVAFDPERRTATCLLAGSQAVEVVGVGFAVVRALAGLSTPPLEVPVPIPVTADVLAPLVGSYRSDLGLVMEVTRRADRLYAHLPGQPSWRIVPTSESEFHYLHIDARVVFQRAPGDAPAPRLTLHQNGVAHAFERR